MNTVGWRPTWGPLGFDVAVALVFASTYEMQVGQLGNDGAAGLVDPGVAPLGLVQTVHAASALLLVVRRRAPLVCALGICMLTLLSPHLAAFASAYSAGAYIRRRAYAWTLVIGTTVAFAQPWEHRFALPQAAGLAATVLAVGLLGGYVGARHRHARVLDAQTEEERRTSAERARLEERSRIAGEMHDLITHRVSLMVLQAGALRTSAADEPVRRAAEQLRLVGCQTLNELRDLVGVLHAEGQIGTALAGDPVVLDVSDLVANSQAAGVQVEVRSEKPAPAMSPVTARTAHRVVQEALTNVHKHAPGARVDIQVRHSRWQVRVEVRNTPAPGHPDLPHNGAGSGLAGLRKRVELVGGTLQTGPSDDGGFEVVAELPAVSGTSGGAA